MLLVGNSLRYYVCQNYPNITWFDKVIAKIKCCSFFYSHGIISFYLMKSVYLLVAGYTMYVVVMSEILQSA